MKAWIVLLPFAALALSGCAALGLTVASVGASAFTAGAKEALHAGTEYTQSGKAIRTFSLSLEDLRIVLGDTLARMEIAVVRDEMDDGEREIEARAQDREIQIRLEPVTRTVTRLKLMVKEGHFGKDRATASEIVAQTERTAEARETALAAASRAATAPPAAAASPPRRAARR